MLRDVSFTTAVAPFGGVGASQEFDIFIETLITQLELHVESGTLPTRRFGASTALTGTSRR